MNNVRVYYFSGTGNARALANWFCEAAREHGLACELSDIGGLPGDSEHLSEPSSSHDPACPPSPDTLLVFIAPIHAFNFPKVMLDFLRAFPAGKNRVALIAARGGMKLGNGFTPGLSGAAFWWNARTLRRKGYTIIGAAPFDLPANCQAIYPAQTEAASAQMFARAREKLCAHAAKILAGQNDFPARNDRIQDALLTPVAFGYALSGRFSFAKFYYADAACLRCGQCARICPFQAIVDKNSRPYWTLRCQSCMRCFHNCPVNAIQTSHGLLVASGIISAVCAGLLAWAVAGAAPAWLVGLLGLALFGLLFTPVQLALYPLQHKLLGSPLLNRAITRLSLSSYKFWGRYKYRPDKPCQTAAKKSE